VVQRTGKIVNKRELAEVFGVSPQAIDGWLSRGCPVLEKGAPLVGYKFDTAAVAEWRAEQRVSEAIGGNKPASQEDAFQRKTAAEAALAELKLARELGQLVTLEDVERVWQNLAAMCRARMLAIPSNIARLAFSAESVDEARAIIENAIHEALNELAAAGITEDSPDSPDGPAPARVEVPGDDEGAPKAHDKPVGRRKAPAKSRRQRRARPVGHRKG
jgi:phage terminase Nu1 subunit (DNA packaging protein)